MTIEDLRAKGLLTKQASREGCWRFETDIKVRALRDGRHEISGAHLIKRGDIYEANMCDEDGHYPNTLHCCDVGYWWPLEMFEFVTE